MVHWCLVKPLLILRMLLFTHFKKKTQAGPFLAFTTQLKITVKITAKILKTVAKQLTAVLHKCSIPDHQSGFHKALSNGNSLS